MAMDPKPPQGGRLPIWVGGGSASTTAAIHTVAVEQAKVPLGLTIFAPVGGSADADAIVTPAQIIYHVEDTISNADAPGFYAAFDHASARELVAFSGGIPGGECNGYHLMVGLDTELVAAMTTFITKYNPAVPPSGPAAIEYFNAGFGHYFMTADADEIDGLDGGAYGGAFVRTGRQFNVFDAPGIGETGSSGRSVRE